MRYLFPIHEILLNYCLAFHKFRFNSSKRIDSYVQFIALSRHLTPSTIFVFSSLLLNLTLASAFYWGQQYSSAHTSQQNAYPSIQSLGHNRMWPWLKSTLHTNESMVDWHLQNSKLCVWSNQSTVLFNKSISKPIHNINKFNWPVKLAVKLFGRWWPNCQANLTTYCPSWTVSYYFAILKRQKPIQAFIFFHWRVPWLDKPQASSLPQLHWLDPWEVENPVRSKLVDIANFELHLVNALFLKSKWLEID